MKRKEQPRTTAAPIIIPDAKTGAPAFAVLRYPDYERLLAETEEREDRNALARIDAEGLGELVPHSVMRRLAAGESPLRVWREYRGLNQSALARRAKVPQPTISAIESGARAGGVATMQRLARALNVELEDLVETAA